MVIPLNIGGGRSGGFGITMLPGGGLLAGQLKQFAGEVKSFRPILEEIRNEVVIPAIRENFATESGAGETWAKLAPDTEFMPYRAERGAGDNPILDVTGKLKRVAAQKNIWLFDGQAGTMFVKQLPGAEYGEIQQQGGPNYGLKGDLSNIPPRPFIIINQQHVEKAEEIFSNWVSEKFNKVVGYVAEGRTVGSIVSGEN